MVRGERWPVERSTDITTTEWDPTRYLHTRYLHTTNKISVTRRGAPYQVKYFKCILSGSLKFLSQFIVRNDVYTLSMGPWYRWLYTDIYTLTVCISSWYQVIIRTCSWIFGVLGKIPPNIFEYLCHLCILSTKRPLLPPPQSGCDNSRTEDMGTVKELIVIWSAEKQRSWAQGGCSQGVVESG